MDKLDKFYNIIVDILGWAVEQKHITTEAANILDANIKEMKESITEEE